MTSVGRHLGVIWATSGAHLDDIRMLCGRHMGVIWTTFVIHLDDILRISWRKSGDQLDDIFVPCGRHLWVIWTTSGGLSEDRTGKPTTCPAMELGIGLFWTQRLTIAPNGCFKRLLFCFCVCVFLCAATKIDWSENASPIYKRLCRRSGVRWLYQPRPMP